MINKPLLDAYLKRYNRLVNIYGYEMDQVTLEDTVYSMLKNMDTLLPRIHTQSDINEFLYLLPLILFTMTNNF